MMVSALLFINFGSVEISNVEDGAVAAVCSKGVMREALVDGEITN